MVVCLYYPEEDYLAAIEQACLSSGLVSWRIRLFSEERLWRLAVQAEDFSGIAAGPRTSLNNAELAKGVKVLVLTDAFIPAENEFSIYEPIDALNRAIQKQMGTIKAMGESGGLHFIFSFQSCYQQRQAFEGFKAQLYHLDPLAVVIDLTTIANISGKVDETLTEWLWEGEDAVFSEGGCYSLCHRPQDVSALFLPQWQDKLTNAVMGMPHSMWFWCGTDWREMLIKLIPFVKSTIWICDHPREVESAVAWTEMIKNRQFGIGGYLISSRGSRHPSAIHLEGAFDGQFETLTDCVGNIVAGGRR
ncbi:hypothetical protein [Acidaminobacter sp.]|uniref:hypothetical protein n=1 Tax=Acidaminobacter sp. TaxID=1872102 RepID=UPI00137D93C1|nr:hypothetical protein [Acidaminobacter sp.]MDK9709699.1 hypothetical protein [Acidaminobacter sp.]MZQ96944.1 hypothetical protein [Acidaminobacter sp.]